MTSGLPPSAATEGSFLLAHQGEPADQHSAYRRRWTELRSSCLPSCLRRCRRFHILAVADRQRTSLAPTRTLRWTPLQHWRTRSELAFSQFLLLQISNRIGRTSRRQMKFTSMRALFHSCLSTPATSLREDLEDLPIKTRETSTICLFRFHLDANEPEQSVDSGRPLNRRQLLAADPPDPGCSIGYFLADQSCRHLPWQASDRVASLLRQLDLQQAQSTTNGHPST